MTDITTRVCEIVAAHVEPQLRHLVSEDAAFEDLRLAMDHAWSIASDWEIENGVELDWGRVEKWASVRDVINTIRQHEKVPS